MNNANTGMPVNRVDGWAKVTGAAKYAAEHYVEGLTFCVVVPAAIAKGKVSMIDCSNALRQKGVLQIFTHENRTALPWFDRTYKDEDRPPGSPFRPLYSNEIQFAMQPIALVV